MLESRWVRLASLIGVVVCGCFAVVLFRPGLLTGSKKAPPTDQDDSERAGPSAAYVWLDIALEATAREHDRVSPRPTVGSRMLGMIVSSMYDAWAAYDEKAVGTRLGDTLRRPLGERTLANKETALAFATYRTLVYLFPEEQKWLDEQMKEQGFDPQDDSTDPSTPQGVGNAAAAAVIAYRRHDGANQHGDEEGSNGVPYSDYTFYRFANPPDKIIDPDCWQPIPFDNGKGGKVTPGFLTPHWYRVKLFALKRSNQFCPPPPPKAASEQMRKEVDEVLAFNASLTPEQKAMVEFMRIQKSGETEVAKLDHATVPPAAFTPMPAEMASRYRYFEPLFHLEQMREDTQRRIVAVSSRRDRVAPFFASDELVVRLKALGHKAILIETPAQPPTFHYTYEPAIAATLACLAGKS